MTGIPSLEVERELTSKGASGEPKGQCEKYTDKAQTRQNLHVMEEGAEAKAQDSRPRG